MPAAEFLETVGSLQDVAVAKDHPLDMSWGTGHTRIVELPGEQ
jgi:hypothetical protein